MAEATRPPERSDLLRLCAELNGLGAKYIVIGGLAMNELGLVRVTEDICSFLIWSRSARSRTCTPLPCAQLCDPMEGNRVESP
jgi:hypothetical protein